MTALERLGARLIWMTGAFDRAYGLFSRLRSRLVLTVASDGLLHAYNDVSYGHARDYHAGAAQFRKPLFHWEEDAISTFFPPPPARVLIGGAGGGREALNLAERGYTVVAFDPSSALIASLLRVTSAAGSISAFVGRYEDLPTLSDTAGHRVAPLTELPAFSAAILGWASLSHLRTPAARVAALRSMASTCDGPLLVSFFGNEAGTSDDRFAMNIGYYRLFSESEIVQLAEQAGLTVVAIDMDVRDGRWPHAVLKRP